MLIDTRLVLPAVTVDNTLGSAAVMRVTYSVGLARADSSPGQHLAKCVYATWTRYTRVTNRNLFCNIVEYTVAMLKVLYGYVTIFFVLVFYLYNCTFLSYCRHLTEHMIRICTPFILLLFVAL